MNYQPYTKLAAFAALMLLPVLSHAQQWRVVTEINDHYYDTSSTSYRTIDSIVYEYDPLSNRGSNYNNDTINCDRAYRYVNEHWNQQYRLQGRELHTYDQNDNRTSKTTQYVDANNNWVNEAADSLYYSNDLLVRNRRYKEVQRQGTPSYELEVEYRYTYDTLDRLDVVFESHLQGLQMGNTDRYTYGYYGLGKVAAIDHTYKDKNAWKDKGGVYYNYNGANMLSLKTIKEVDTQAKNTYYTSTSYYYDAQNKLILDSLNVYMNQQLDPLINSYTYNSQGQLTRHRMSTPNDSIKITEYRYKYTSFGYVSEVERFISTDSVLRDTLFGYRTRYFYEAYWPVGVKEATADAKDITLYPNPAVNVLHIATSEAYTQGRIYNSMGQIVKLVNANSKQIDVTQLPAGNYYLQLSTNDKTTSKRFTIVR